MTPDYAFDTGAHARPVSTRSEAAQTWFNRGLVWLYGYNHEEAVRCFRRALEADPGLGIAWWGVALASGPFYNMPWGWFSDAELAEAAPLCHDAAQRARGLIATASPAEAALIAAVCARYPAPDPDRTAFAAWDDAYASAMRDAHRAFPQDADIAALFAEAMMTRTPWALWDVWTGAPAATADTAEILDVIETAIANVAAKGAPPHPGLAHMHIHAWEMSATPERALASALALPGLAPDVGHLEHMPGHIHALLGRWEDAITVSARAIAADTLYEHAADPAPFYVTARCHDLHLMMFAAMMAGRFAPAMRAARRIMEILSPETLSTKRPHLAVTMEGYYAAAQHVLIRFGRWSEILSEPAPPCPVLYPVTTAMHHYARGVARAALGDVSGAGREQALFRAATGLVPADRRYFNNAARDILHVGEEMLEGERLYRAGALDRAFAALTRAVTACDRLTYNEPWSWMHPPRHALGALLLEQGRLAEAHRVYENDLGLSGDLPRCRRHPDNIWSLHGLVECRDLLGFAATAERRRLTALSATSDVTISASCCCRGAALVGVG